MYLNICTWKKFLNTSCFSVCLLWREWLHLHAMLLGGMGWLKQSFLLVEQTSFFLGACSGVQVSVAGSPVLKHGYWCLLSLCSLISFADFLRAHSIAFSWLLIKMLNRICIRLDPCNTPLLNSIQVMKGLLATIIWAQPSKLFFTHSSTC